VSTDPQSLLIVPGTRFQVDDRFRTENEFHGGELGVVSEIRRGRWSVQGIAKLALGTNRETVDITGSTITTVPNQAPMVTPGGLLTQPTNIGHYARNVFAVVPETDIAVRYQVTQRLRASVGYSLIYWDKVVRPGDQIDLVVNQTQIGNNPLIGPARPQFFFHDSSFWVQGITLGLQWDF